MGSAASMAKDCIHGSASIESIDGGTIGVALSRTCKIACDGVDVSIPVKTHFHSPPLRSRVSEWPATVWSPDTMSNPSTSASEEKPHGVTWGFTPGLEPLK